MNTFKTRANGAAQRNATLISRMPEFLFPIGAASMLAGCACDENVLNLAIGLFSLSVFPRGHEPRRKASGGQGLSRGRRSSALSTTDPSCSFSLALEPRGAHAISLPGLALASSVDVRLLLGDGASRAHILLDMTSGKRPRLKYSGKFHPLGSQCRGQ